MFEIINKVQKRLQSALPNSERIRLVLAVSGGVDSMVLLHMLQQVQSRWQDHCQIEIVVAHFDHRLRPESWQEQDLILDYLNQRPDIYSFGVWEEPAETNVEARAREARYQFFAETLLATESQFLLTGHHLNDLAETMLMRTIRGSSIKGLSGFAPQGQRDLKTKNGQFVRAEIIRPLFDIPKEVLYDYAAYYQVPYLEDQTNQEDDFLRNRIRHQMIPYILTENPQFLNNALAMSEQLNASYQVHYESYLQDEASFVMPLAGDGWLIYIPWLKVLSKAKRQIYLLLFFEERLIDNLNGYSKSLIQQFEWLILQEEAPNMTLDLGEHWQAKRVYDYLRIEYLGTDQTIKESRPLSFNIHEVNKWYKLSQNEYIGVFDKVYAQNMHQNVDSFQLGLRLDEDQPLNLIVRHRQAGDRLALQRRDGQLYHKKIARIFIDQKVPRAKREQYWVVAQPEGEVLCLLPHISHDELYQDSQKATHLLYYQTQL